MNQTAFLWEPRFDDNFAVDLDAGLGPLIRGTRTTANAAGSLLTNAADYAKFRVAVTEGRGLKPEVHATMVAPQIGISSRSLFSAPGTDGGKNAAIALSWALGWGRFRSPAGDAMFHLGLEEGCEDYAVIFPERRTALVMLSVTNNQRSFTRDLARELIGDTYSPFAWLGY